MSWIEALFATIKGCPRVDARGALTGRNSLRVAGREFEACNRASSKQGAATSTDASEATAVS